MSDVATIKPEIASAEQPIDQIKEPVAPEPTAIGNERIAVLNHQLAEIKVGVDNGSRSQPGIELAIRNISETTIATAVFEAVLYDQGGAVVGTVKHTEGALEPNRSRAVVINYSHYDYDKVKSYDVRLTRTTSADVEKVQLRRHEATTNGFGEEEIEGILKNISRVKADVAVVANFYDTHSENIGTKVVVVRDIEPDSIRQYRLKFKPQDGDRVHSYTVQIGELEA